MFEVAVEQTFAAGHALRNYRGKCENVHGHNYRLLVTVRGENLDDTGLLVDFIELKRVTREVIERLDHQFINDIPPFDVLNPSAENIARYFYEEISKGIGAHAQATVQVFEVKVWETDTSSATYRRA
jgi:6-pyruvoyltetrahydropterin/6-carboxytetrahydropterin synthase